MDGRDCENQSCPSVHRLNAPNGIIKRTTSCLYAAFFSRHGGILGRQRRRDKRDYIFGSFKCAVRMRLCARLRRASLCVKPLLSASAGIGAYPRLTLLCVLCASAVLGVFAITSSPLLPAGGRKLTADLCLLPLRLLPRWGQGWSSGGQRNCGMRIADFGLQPAPSGGGFRATTFPKRPACYGSLFKV